MMTMGDQRYSAPLNKGIQNMNFLTSNELVGRYPFAHANRPAGTLEQFQASRQDTGPIDKNRLLWLFAPYSIDNPYMPASRVRNPAQEASNTKDELSDTVRLLPRDGYKRRRAGGRPVAHVRFEEAPPLAQ